MNPRDATPAPYSFDDCKLLAVPVALVIVTVRHTSRLGLAVTVLVMLVAIGMVVLATSSRADRRHGANERILREFEITACRVWHPARYCVMHPVPR